MPIQLVKCLAMLLATFLSALNAPMFTGADGWKSVPLSSSESDSQQCKKAVFIGARGSGEQPGQSRTIQSIRDQIAAQPDVTRDVRQMYIDYPAADVNTMAMGSFETMLLDEDINQVEFWESTNKGVAEVKRVLLENVQRCPNEKIVLVGYSQGAEAVNRGLTAAVRESDRVAKNLVAAVLLGNPGKYPSQNTQTLDGTDNPNSGGLSATLWYLRSKTLTGNENRLQQVQAILKALFDLYENKVPMAELQPVMTELGYTIPESIADRVYSVCNDGDAICDSIPALTRILSAQSSVNTEMANLEPQHKAYPDISKSTVEAVGKALAESTTKKKSDDKPSSDEPSDHADRGWLPWLLGGIAAVVAGGAGIALRRRR